MIEQVNSPAGCCVERTLLEGGEAACQRERTRGHLLGERPVVELVQPVLV
ncbi:MAG: hypothetical protein ABR592_04340 [Nitriliruptorales bacterium]